MTGHRSPNERRVTELAKRIARLNDLQIDEVERFLVQLEPNGEKGRFERESGPGAPGRHSKSWPHAPLHRLAGKGTYIVTAGTLNKEHHFQEAELLDLLESELLAKAKQYRWQLEAWAVFSNHYHFVAHALEDSGTLKPFLTHLHADTARMVNSPLKYSLLPRAPSPAA